MCREDQSIFSFLLLVCQGRFFLFSQQFLSVEVICKVSSLTLLDHAVGLYARHRLVQYKSSNFIRETEPSIKQYNLNNGILTQICTSFYTVVADV